MSNIIINIENVKEKYKNPFIDSIKDTFSNKLLYNFSLSNIDVKDQLFVNCAGNILEEFIKLNLTNINTEEIRRHFKIKENEYYDFKYDLQNVKIITFNENKEYSDNTLSLTQTYKAATNELMFLCIIYNVESNIITISDIKFVDGNSIKTYNDRIQRSKLIEYDYEYEEEIVNDILPVRMLFTSNLNGIVQILNI